MRKMCRSCPKCGSENLDEVFDHVMCNDCKYYEADYGPSFKEGWLYVMYLSFFVVISFLMLIEVLSR